jgi:hypothetical protein
MEYTLKLEMPESVYEPLVKVAEQRGQSPEELACEWLIMAIRAATEDPVENFIGAFKGAVPDWADQHDRYIGQTLIAQIKNIDDAGH